MLMIKFKDSYTIYNLYIIILFNSFFLIYISGFFFFNGHTCGIMEVPGISIESKLQL